MPERFGAYVIHEALGAGGMASVHLAEWRPLSGTQRSLFFRSFALYLLEIIAFRAYPFAEFAGPRLRGSRYAIGDLAFTYLHRLTAHRAVLESH